MRFRILLSTVVLLLATTGAAIAEPQRVLLLHPLGRDFVPWSQYGKTVREELLRQLPDGIDLYETALVSARSGDVEEGPFADYVQALFVKHKPDLVVGISSPAISFIQKHREKLFPSVPAVFMGVDQRRISRIDLTTHDALIVTDVDFKLIIENILKLLPNISNIAVVLGNSPNNQYGSQQIPAGLKPFENGVAFRWFNKLSFKEVLRRAAALPPNPAIFFVFLS